MQPWKIVKFRNGLAVVFNDNEGKRRRYSLAATEKKNAAPEAMEIVTEFFQKRPEDVLVADILEAYKEHLGVRPAAERIKNLRAIKEYFGHYRPSQISEDLVSNYIDQRTNLLTGKKVKDETLWTELGALRSALSYAARRRKMFSVEDIPYIPRPQKPAPRDRPLSREEVKRLLRCAKNVPHLYIALLLMLGTAGRATAILELTWDRVDFQKGTIDLRVSSAGPRKGRAKVPMNPGLRRALTDWRRISETDFVIAFNGSAVKSIKTAFNRAIKNAELNDVRQHDLRHTAAVWMLEAGSSIQRISQYLGHSSLDQTFKVYARYQPDFLRAEAISLDVSDMIFDDCMEKNSHGLQYVTISDTPYATLISIDRLAVPVITHLISEKVIALVKETFQQSQEPPS